MKLLHKPRFLWLFGIFLLYLAIHYWDALLLLLSAALSAAKPLILGLEIAYVANILMSLIERHFAPKSETPRMKKLRRTASLLISFLGVLILVGLLVWMILPEFVRCMQLLTQQLPSLFNVAAEKLKRWALTDTSRVQELEKTLEQWFSVALGFMGDGATWLISQITGLVSSISTLVIAMVFSVYMLASKEKLTAQFGRVCRAYIPEKVRKPVHHILSTANTYFRSYIVGQCTEAALLGTLCALGMLILGIPYAAMVGCVVGITALIPILGSYIGAIVGAVMIFTISPIKALVFIVFLILLQQVEGNLIYPRVVGSSIGLPGLWVLAAVTVGGGLWGIPGMIVGVPITATCYALLREDLHRRDGAHSPEGT